jgi:hypothetical protein
LTHHGSTRRKPDSSICNFKFAILNSQWAPLLALLLACESAHAAFTRLQPVPKPRITSSSEPYPGGRHEASNLLDGNLRTEYSSNGQGTNTFVEFDFGKPTPLAAFEHVDRNDPALVGCSELSLLDASGNVVTNFSVTHVNRRSGATWFPFPVPVTAQRIRWQITGLGGDLRTVGGAEIRFYSQGESETLPRSTTVELRPRDLLERHGSETVQPLDLIIQYPYAEPTGARVHLGNSVNALQLKPGNQTIELRVPPVSRSAAEQLSFDIAGQQVFTRSIIREPVRHYEIFLLPHSHNDIGYTALQAEVVKKQISNIDTGLRLAKETAAYPESARFKWNTEVLWCVDNYLREAAPQQRADFVAAVKSGQIGLDAFYCNILTGLCRPEELLRLMRFATQLEDLCGVRIESAMISDVPGYTWSAVTAMAQAGVKYFSFAPNYFDRMGGTMKEWQNRPFWWKGPDGRERVLCWCPSRGYALGHLIGDGEALARFIPDYLEELKTNSYPYDITHLRWNVHGDNGSPDEKLADVVRDWNARYVYPRLIISTTAEAFRSFEKRYGDKLPEFSGDYTPYWEDGAASSASETALNRATSERLTQAETLWVMRRPKPFPADGFNEAWRNVLLYSEHTWGAHNSISQPDLPFVRDQWKVKQAFALDADRQSHQLLDQALGVEAASSAGANAVDVFNTSSWPRTDLVSLAGPLSHVGDQVVDEKGRTVASQRLYSGELVFLAEDVPPFAAKRFTFKPGPCPAQGSATASTDSLSSPDYVIRLDPEAGGIKSLVARKTGRELVSSTGRTRLNDFFYLPGADLKKLERSGRPTIRVKEKGPLVASVVIESEAPGCKQLIREVRLIDGVDRVELINTVDKLPIRAKEGLHFGYGFNVPGGEARFDVGWAVVRPELDQIPASCKNWFSVQRWVDISNDKFGVTWAPLDAPLVELGDITANLIGSQTDWRVWIQHLGPSQTIYSWVMNNHWHTNYRADQEGPTVFRYAICAHGPFAADEAARFGQSYSQPLLAMSARDEKPAAPRLQLSSSKVLVAGLKPTGDGRGWLIRLFGASGKTERVSLAWSKPALRQLWLSDTSEKALKPASRSIEVPAWGLVTLRAE